MSGSGPDSGSDDYEANKRKILDEEDADIKFLKLTDELKRLGVKVVGFRGAYLYVQCNGQPEPTETVLYRDNLQKTLQNFDEWTKGIFNDQVRQAVISFISTVWDKEFRDDEHDSTADENRIKQIIRLRVTEEDIKFVYDIMYREAEYDRVSVNQIFLGMMSGATKVPQGHNINSRKSGVGKSYDLNHVAWFFPDRYTKILVGSSSKAFLHKEGEMVLINSDGSYIPVQPILTKLQADKDAENDKLEIQKEMEPKSRDKEKVRHARKRIKEIENEIAKLLQRQQKFIELEGLIIIIQDTVQDSFYDAMMSLISQDTKGNPEYIYTEQSGKGKFGAKTNTFHGMPLIFTTRVTDDTENKRFAEKNRRLINVNPNVSELKIRAANALLMKQAGLLPEEYDEEVVSKEDKERAKKIIEIMFEKMRYHSSFLGPKETGMKIFFQAAIANAMPGKDPWSMTVTDRIRRYLTAQAGINQDSRPRYVNVETGAYYIIPIFVDLRAVLDLMDKAGSNVRPYQSEWYETTFLPEFDKMEGKPKEYPVDSITVEREKVVGLTSADLAVATGESSKKIRDDFLYPLYNCGLVDSVPSILDGREKIWFPVDIKDKAFSLFEDPKDKRLTIKNPQVYPDQFVIEQSTRRRKIYDAEVGGIKNKKNISKIYRLEDADGTEISVQKMIEKYFSNPEICFIKDFSKYEQNVAVANVRNIEYCSQIVRNQQEKNYFFRGVPPRHKFTEFSKNSVEDSSISIDTQQPERRSEAN